MNPHIDDKTPLTKDEYKELENLVSKGEGNFSKETLKSAVYLHPANPHPPSASNIIYSASAKYLFRCNICTEIGMPIQWYKIILDTVGGTPLFHERSNTSDLQKGYNGINLAKISDNDKTDYQESSINLLEGKGYICDHCRDSCFDEEGKSLD